MPKEEQVIEKEKGLDLQVRRGQRLVYPFCFDLFFFLEIVH